MKSDKNRTDETTESLLRRIKLTAGLDQMADEMQDSIYNDVTRRINRARQINYRLKWISVAASLFILIGAGAMLVTHLDSWNAPEQLSVYNPEGSTPKSIFLPDGTEVILNSGSTIVYPSRFNKSIRNVTLTGEAYFDVQKNPDKKFVVQTAQLEVTVYGTQFAVEAWNEDNEVEVTLRKGSVGVKPSCSLSETTLKPGEQVCYNKERQTLDIRQVDPDNALAWKKGIIRFENESLQSIASTLERTYNVDIQIMDDSLKQILFSGEFKKGEELERILRVITSDKRSDYKIDGSTVSLYVNK